MTFRHLGLVDKMLRPLSAALAVLLVGCGTVLPPVSFRSSSLPLQHPIMMPRGDVLRMSPFGSMMRSHGSDSSLDAQQPSETSLFTMSGKSSVDRLVAGTPAAGALENILDTRLAESRGRTRRVNQGGDFQAALEQAQPGDVIMLEAGATFIGNFVLPKKTGSGWVTIRSSTPNSELPNEGTRITPLYAPRLAKVLSPNSDAALKTVAGAHHFRIMALEFGVVTSKTLNYGIIVFGSDTQKSAAEAPSNIVLDRVYVHGHPTLQLSRCVTLNSASTAVIDSYLSECHSSDQEAQGIVAWNGPGPFKIVNNYIEGSGINILFGGSDPAIPGLVHSDIEVRRNHLFKPTSWKGRYPVKNHFELKNAQRVLVEGNVMENCWLAGQDGYSVVLKTLSQVGAGLGSAPWTTTSDVTFRYNLIKNVGAGFNLSGVQFQVGIPMNRIEISNNLILNMNTGVFTGAGRGFLVLDATRNVVIAHNTIFPTLALIAFAGMKDTNFVFRDNIGGRGQYGVTGDGAGEGTKALDAFLVGYTFVRNAIVGPGTTAYPAGNFFPLAPDGVGFVNFAAGDFRLSAISPYKNAGTDGKDLGADIDAIESATKGVVLP